MYSKASITSLFLLFIQLLEILYSVIKLHTYQQFGADLTLQGYFQIFGHEVDTLS